MSRIIRSKINSALNNIKIKAVFFNINKFDEVSNFDVDIYTFDNINDVSIHKLDSNNINNILPLEFDCIINLRPYAKNIEKIVSFGQQTGLPIYNYIIDIEDMKPEILMRHSQYLERFKINFVKNEELSKKIYLPNKTIGTEKEFTECIISI